VKREQDLIVCGSRWSVALKAGSALLSKLLSQWGACFHLVGIRLTVCLGEPSSSWRSCACAP
jgi:hypothetical protein